MTLRPEFRAGGTDVHDRRRLGLTDAPILDVARSGVRRDIQWDDGGAAALGALVPVHEVAMDARIRAAYPGLAAAAGGLATPQIRRMATLGGNLLQRNRCPYFRHAAFTCYQDGGSRCPARAGDHQHGVAFDLGPCVQPHPSTLGMALLAYQATVEVHDRLGEARSRSITDLYGDGADPRRDHTLSPGEVLARVLLPPPLPAERAAYFRAISRREAEWAAVEALALLVVQDGLIASAAVVVGAVARIPLRLSQVERTLHGRPPSARLLQTAADQAGHGASPLPQTAWKLPLLSATVLEVLHRAVGSQPWESADGP